MRLVLNYSISPQLGVYAIAGQENNNYATINSESHGSGGAGVNWSISDRTKLAEAERRFFARTHKINFEHGRLHVWRFTDAKDAQTNPRRWRRPCRDLVRSLLRAFASIEPDPILRAQMVNAFLQANGPTSMRWVIRVHRIGRDGTAPPGLVASPARCAIR